MEQVTFPGGLTLVPRTGRLSACPVPVLPRAWLSAAPCCAGSLQSLTPPFTRVTLFVICEDFLYCTINYKLTSRN